MLPDLAALAGGVLILAKAPDLFVVGAGRIALALRVSPVVVGAVVIGFGTSAPELLVSGLAAAQGATDIAVGNLVGSNIANVTLVAGLAAIVAAPLAVSSATLRREAPIAFAAVVLLALAIQGGLARWEAAALLAALAVGLVWMVRAGQVVHDDPLGEEAESRCAPDDRHGLAREAGRTLAGLLGVLVAAQLIVTGATGVAADVGLSDAFVGVVIVGIGTSLPEIATATQAARRGEHDLIVGNLFGSNMFNSLGIGAVVALAGPGQVAGSLTGLGAAAMVLAGAVAWILLGTRRELTRLEAAGLLAGYAAVVPFL